MTPLEEFYEFKKHHNVEFDFDEQDSPLFCLGTECEKCVISKKCTNDTLSVEDLEVIKNEFPELFI